LSQHHRETPRVAVLATLDTKGDEARFLADRLRSRGVTPLLIDLALTGTSPDDADITRADLARHGATDASGDDRTAAMESTATAAADVLRSLVDEGEIQGVVGIGGGTGGWMSQRAVEPLPFGFPKVVVTTVVKPSGEHDIVFIPSVVDVAGLNVLLRTVLGHAASALAGMVAGDAQPSPVEEGRPAVAMTMFGVTTAGGDVARATLEAAGFDVVVFHATGAGGRTMERLIADGRFAGVLDWTTTELVQHVAGGLCDAGAERLRAAAEHGVPQVVVPGAVDVINVLPPVPDEYAERVTHWHLPTVPLVRASAAESAAVGRWIGERLSTATAPAAVLIPRGGFSSLDVAGGDFEDEAADAAFETAVRTAIGDGTVITSPLHINDAEFARQAAETLLQMLDVPRQDRKE
jgi:uncharacterized protein (UPF0261 family)